MSRIPFYLITGFLGSGKTTFLKNVLDHYADDHRLAIVQNEFAPGQVDGQELKRSGKYFELLEVNKGSVFCVCLLSDFEKSLVKFVDEIQPDKVLLEATGLADPIAIGELLESSELKKRFYLAQVFCVIDAVNFLKLEPTMTRLRHQVRIADTVLINKTDLLEGAADEIISTIKRYNPFCEIIETTYCQFDRSPWSLDEIENPVAVSKIETELGLEPGGRPDVESKVIRTTRKASASQFSDKIKQLGDVLYRIKGFVCLDDGSVAAIQSSFGTTEIKFVDDYQGPSEIILMGPDLQKSADLYRSIFR
jgi:G3E family GTPase